MQHFFHFVVEFSGWRRSSEFQTKSLPNSDPDPQYVLTIFGFQVGFVSVFKFFFFLTDSDFFRGKGIKTEINGILPLESVRSQGFARGGGGRLETISRDVTKVSKLFSF